MGEKIYMYTSQASNCLWTVVIKLLHFEVVRLRMSNIFLGDVRVRKEDDMDFVQLSCRESRPGLRGWS